MASERSRNKGFNTLYFIITFFLLFFPIISLAVSSTNYIVDPSGTDALHQTTSSTNYQLEGSLEPIVGQTSATNYAAEAGSSFAGYCGDGFIDPTEDCEGADLNSKTCVTQGFVSGTLSCAATCTFNTTACTSGGGGTSNNNFPPPSPSFADAISTKSFTYASDFMFWGYKATDAIVYVNGSNSGVSYSTAGHWQKTVSLTLGGNSISIVAHNNFGDSGSVSVTMPRRKAGDVNNDGVVNDYDFSLLANHWNTNWAEANFNRDDPECAPVYTKASCNESDPSSIGLNKVDDFDLSLMGAFWSK